MEKNVGGADKVIRLVAGALVIGAGVYYESWWGALGLVLIVTAVAGVCPGYMPFRISTCKRHPEGKAS